MTSTLTRSRILLVAFLLACMSGSAAAQDYAVQKPRRQFVTISIDWLNTEPLHFDSRPLVSPRRTRD